MARYLYRSGRYRLTLHGPVKRPDRYYETGEVRMQGKELPGWAPRLPSSRDVHGDMTLQEFHHVHVRGYSGGYPLLSLPHIDPTSGLILGSFSHRIGCEAWAGTYLVLTPHCSPVQYY